MLFRSIRFFFLIFSLAFSSSLLAQDNYQQWVDDITARLDKTSQLIQQGNTDDARTEVQMAYFEVFENLEGPIRINFSAQRSYQMEATFGEIRKMIGEGSSQKEIQAKIDQLKKNYKKCYHHWLKVINSMLMDNMAFMIIKRLPLIGNKVLKPLMT